MDGIDESQGRMQMTDEQQAIHHHAHFIQEHDHHVLQHLSNGNGMEQDDNGGGSDDMEGEIPPDHGNLSDNHNAMVAHGGSESNNQLTLSFQGQVYVFDSVLPEKVSFSSSFSIYYCFVYCRKVAFKCRKKLNLMFKYHFCSSSLPPQH